ncbi:o-succinylbenzoate--CoA ligase [Vibrio sp. MA40-2]|uniref:o-succinylbenzoate--CoA ligase n=1 Tax=Vibrio sp. MA40-2 TaxID=3391828 RepID=UPI0039A6D7B9
MSNDLLSAKSQLSTTECGLECWRQRTPSETALRYAGKAFTWLEIGSVVDRLSQSLLEQGVVRGGVVALVSKNNLGLLLTYLACSRVGAISAFIAPTTANQLQEKLQVLGDCHYWVHSSGFDMTDGDKPCDTALAKCDTSLAKVVSAPNYRPLHISIDWNTDSPLTPCPDVSEQDLTSIIFTSGTTGSAKAVAHTKQQHIASAQGLLERFKFNKQHTWLLSLPMYHVSGLAIVWRWLVTGACIKIGEGADLYQDLQQVTHASLVTTQLKRLLDDGRSLCLTRVLLGGSHIPITLAQAANQRGIDTWLGYGMTEAASTVMAKPVDGRVGVGFLLPKRNIKIDDKRIFISGETLASGYFSHGFITPLTDNGWFDSKDLGEWHGDEICILGRADNQFISGGENIHCEEIEKALSFHPQVKSVMVVAVKDSAYGARPVAVVQCEKLLNKSEYEQVIAKQLDKFKWPIDYVLMPEFISQSSAIKIPRAKIKQWFSENITNYTLVS